MYNTNHKRVHITRRMYLLPAAVITCAGIWLSSLSPVYAVTSAWVANSAWNGPSGFSSPAPVLGDLNGDGKLDLLIGDASGVVHAYVNTGTTSAPVWTAQTSWDVTTGGTNASPALADLNGDGLLDLIVGGRTAVRAYQNTGSASAPVWTRNTAWDPASTILPTGNYFTVALADLDHDSKVDMMVGSSLGAVSGYKNTGTSSSPAWSADHAWDTIEVSNRSTVALADVDGDGDYDLFVGGGYGTVYAFQNTGTATAPVWTSIGDWFIADPDLNTKNYAAPALGDLNGDGKIDLLDGYGTTLNGGNGVIIAYQNTGLPSSPTSGTGPPLPPTGATTVDETFDSFTCGGSWTPAPSGPNSSYIRDCGDGWLAYAQDVANSASSTPLSGPIGNQNVITRDSVNGPSAAPATPLGAAEMYTAPDNSVRGVLWLLKTYTVVPGTSISSLKVDFRVQLSGGASAQNVGIIVFDGTVTDPSGATTAGVPQRSDVLASDIISSSCTAGTWCPWNTVDVGGSALTPVHSTITVGLRVPDNSVGQNTYAEFDNLTISDVPPSTTSSSVPVGDIAQLWKAPYLASGQDNMAEPADVAVDGNGNVYMTGRTYNDSNYDIVTIKYDSSGNQVWLRTYDNGDDDRGVAVKLDASGNVYVVGSTYVSGNMDYVAIKYDNSGTQQWASTFATAGNDDNPAGMALDGSGNVYVTGASCTADACDYATVKFDGAGNQAWAKTFSDGGYDEAVGVGLDGSGNVYVTGKSSGTSDTITTIKYDSSGNVAWQKTYDSGTNDRAVAIVTDSAGNSYIAGWNFRSSTPDILVIKYDAGGNFQWSKTYDGGNEDLPAAIALDGSGNVIVTGTVGTVGDHNIVTMKIQPDGTFSWVNNYGNAGFDDHAVDLAVDGNGNAYVLGTLSRSTGNTDFVTLRYDSAGAAHNAITYDGQTLADTAVAIALGVDGQGDTVPVITGISRDTSGLDEIATVRYEKALPDLTMTQLSGPTSGVVGSTIDIANTVFNISNLAAKQYADSGSFDVGFYAAPDLGGAPDITNMSLIGTRTVANLTPGQSDAAVTTLTIPSSVSEGTYFLVAVADSGGAVTEANETNNSITAAGPIAIQGIKPDLAVTAFNGPTSVSQGDTISVSATVTNLVTTAAGSFRVGIYLSTDTTITAGDTLLDSYTVSGGLSGFASDTHTRSVTIPSNLTSCPCYLGVFADDQGAVDEANENNNTELLRNGTATSTRVSSYADFLSGLSVSGTANTGVIRTGTAARVRLAQTPVWTANSLLNAPDVGTLNAKPALGDLNGDGLPDLMIGDYTGLVHAYVNTGTATSPQWTAQTSWNVNLSGTDSYVVPVLADLDGDGDLDLIVAGRSFVSAYQNTGSPSAPVWTRNTAWDVTGLPGNKFYAAALADLDGDGKVDLLLGSVNSLVGYQNTGSTSSPAWTAQPAWNVTMPVTGRYTPRLADLDGDGDYDLLVGDSAGTIYAFQNTGTRTSLTWTENDTWNIADIDGSKNNFPGPAIGDVNGDGNPDVLYGDSGGVSYGYQNTGPFSTPGTYVSKVVDAGTHGGYTILDVVSILPSGTSLTVDVRAGDSTNAGDSSWTSYLTNVPNGGDISSLGTHRYVQYRLHLATTNTAVSPAVYSIQAETNSPPPTAISILTGDGGSSGGGALSSLDLLVMALAGSLAKAVRRRRRA